MKKPQTFKLDPDLIDKLKQLAEKDNRPFNNYVETVLKNHVEAIKKKNRN